MKGPLSATLPDFHRQSEFMFLTIRLFHEHWYRQDHLLKILYRDINPVLILAFVLNRFHRHIQFPVIEDPSAPEPRKIFTGYILHRSEEIPWSWMLIRPALYVFFQSKVKPFRAKNHFS